MMDIRARRRIDPGFASRCPMQRCPDPRRWIIIAHLKHAASRLDSVPGAPPRYKRAPASVVSRK
jgi:hypothetical protein